MIRGLIGGIAAVALMSGAAAAQDSSYYHKTTTLTTPFGSSSRSTTTTTATAPGPVDEPAIGEPTRIGAPDMAPPNDGQYEEQSADVGSMPPPPPPGSAPSYRVETMTRRVTDPAPIQLVPSRTTTTTTTTRDDDE